MSTRNLIDAIASGSALDIESAFEDTMAEKVSVQIEAKRLQIAQTMFTTEEVDLDEGSKSSIRHLYHQYATAYFSSGSRQRPGDLDHHTISAKIEKIHGKKVLGHIKRATDANSRGDTDGELRHLHNAGVHYATEEVEIDEEQLDELSKKTLGSYIKKATHSTVQDPRTIGNLSSKSTEKDIKSGGEDGGEEAHKARMRSKGVAKAVNRLTKEEVDLDEEQLDELGPETTVSYIHKATKDAHDTVAAANAGGDKAMLQKRLDKRKSGITKAMTKIVRKAKEEQEEQE